MLLFVIAVLVYTIALAGMSQLTSNTSYLPLLRRACFIFGAFSCDLLLLILVPPSGWFILILCVCMSVRLICDSHGQILQCFQQIYQSSISLLQRYSTYCAAGSKIVSDHYVNQLPEHSTVLPYQLPTQLRNKW